MNLQLEKWTENDYNSFLEYLKSKADFDYKKFHSSLVPDADKDAILGVRMPVMREIGRQIAKGNARDFLRVSQNGCYEERMLRGIVTGLIKTSEFYDFVTLVNNFVCIIDNWAICDCFCTGIKQVKKYKQRFFYYIQRYIDSDNVWIKRAGLVIMLDYYLEDEYIECVLERCDSIKSDFYYVRMAQAWLVATALAKCYDQTMAYIHNNSLDDFTFNKAVQKCVESRRIDDRTKQYLKSLKRY